MGDEGGCLGFASFFGGGYSPLLALAEERGARAHNLSKRVLGWLQGRWGTWGGRRRWACWGGSGSEWEEHQSRSRMCREGGEEFGVCDYKIGLVRGNSPHKDCYFPGEGGNHGPQRWGEAVVEVWRRSVGSPLFGWGGGTALPGKGEAWSERFGRGWGWATASVHGCGHPL